jgi:hypothetical protein
MLFLVLGIFLLLFAGGLFLVAKIVLVGIVLALLALASYWLNLHEIPLSWMLRRFLTHKTGVRVHVHGVSLRPLRSTSPLPACQPARPPARLPCPPACLPASALFPLQNVLRCLVDRSDHVAI